MQILMMSAPIKNTFTKNERLHSKKKMEALFANGKSAYATPLKLMYLVVNGQTDARAQAMFIVPKRLFKKAHDRNKLKRRTKEAYRLNKRKLYTSLENQNKQLVLAFLYTGKKTESYEIISAAVIALLNKVIR